MSGPEPERGDGRILVFLTLCRRAGRESSPEPRRRRKGQNGPHPLSEVVRRLSVFLPRNRRVPPVLKRYRKEG